MVGGNQAVAAMVGSGGIAGEREMLVWGQQGEWERDGAVDNFLGMQY